MITTSTDYAITKRGMSPQLRKRDKPPLRTYGKRPQATIEPPTKKRKFAPNDDVQDVAKGEGLGTQSEPQQAASALPGKIAKPDCPIWGGKTARTHPQNGKLEPEAPGTILSYFKRVETKSVLQGVREKEEKEQKEDNAASSPPRLARRKPRILRLRATAAPSTLPDTDSHETRPEAPSITNRRRTTKEPLEESKATSGNYQPPVREKDRKRKAAAPVVQMTLNISPQAAFSECKVCDTVWNPLYPDDVKYHQKRHAAVTKKRKSKELEDL